MSFSVPDPALCPRRSSKNTCPRQNPKKQKGAAQEVVFLAQTRCLSFPLDSRHFTQNFRTQHTQMRYGTMELWSILESPNQVYNKNETPTSSHPRREVHSIIHSNGIYLLLAIIQPVSKIDTVLNLTECTF